MNMEAASQHQPKILSFLFIAELWERFAFYVVQGLLVLYMTQFYGFSDPVSYTISGLFTGLVYTSPFIGGFLADKLLGFKTAILWGGFFLVAGYTLLALFSTSFFFYLALATIIIGSGLLKPNIASLLGTQYVSNDVRRDSGFTLFYIGINAGAALSGLSGYVRNAYGFQLTFALASIGMLIGILTFLYGIKHLKNTQKIQTPSTKLKSQLFIYCLLAVIGVCLLLRMTALVYWLFPCAGIILLIFLVVLSMQQAPEYRSRLIALNILILSSIVFWMLFLQIFNSANLFVDRLVNKHLFGIPLSTTIFYALESVYVILLGPLLTFAWQMGNSKKTFSHTEIFPGNIFCRIRFPDIGCWHAVSRLRKFNPPLMGHFSLFIPLYW